MRSEHQHIDDFFKQKEEGWQPASGNPDIGWQAMQGMLKPAPGAPGPKGYRLQTTRRIIKYLGGFTIVTVITVIALTYAVNKKKKAAPKARVEANTTIPPKKQTTATTAPAAVKADNKPATSPATVAHASAKKITPVSGHTSNKAYTYKPTTAQTTTHNIDRDYVRTTASRKPTATRRATPRRNYDQANVLDYLDLKGIKAIDTTNALALKPSRATDTVSALTAEQQLSAFYTQLQKEKQTFTIPVDKDTILTGAEGTRLYISAGTFQNNRRGIIKNGNIKIVLREYYTYDDIVAAKLTTTSGGAQLVSGGMVNITASFNGEVVYPTSLKPIEIQMPTNNYDNQMQLFTGVRMSLKNAARSTFVDNRMMDTVHFMRPELDDNGAIEWTPEWSPIEYRLPRTITIYQMFPDPYEIVHGNKTKAKFYVYKNCTLSDKEIKIKLLEHFNGYYDVIKLRRVERGPTNGTYRNGEESMIVGDSVEMTLGKALRQKLITSEDSARYAERFRQDSINELARDKMNAFYSFRTTKIGWINCDRFLKESGPQVEYTLNAAEGFDPHTVNTYLVFKKYKSVLPGTYHNDKIAFGKVPKDQQVKLVTVGIRNGRVMACFQDRTIGNGKEEPPMEFEETTPEQFRKKLKALEQAL